mmetsp:Transcript_29095/g.92872  ORF Transcript_29095/g.92872 Transcript_29095/m.92872 type:complete len:244 (+) Transcript_29095:422-1153(+)
MVAAPGFQLAGHTSPCVSVYLKAWTRRRISSGLRPTGRSLTVFWRRIPSGEMMKRPLRSTRPGSTPCCAPRGKKARWGQGCAPEGDASVVALLDEDLVVLGDGLGDVGHEGVLAAAEAALLAGLRGPGEVAVLGIHGHADDLAVDVLELLRAIGEGADLGGAHEGEVEGVEEEDDVLALVVRELDVLEIAVGHHRRGGEVGGGLLDGEGHGGECTMRSVLAEDRDHKRNPNFSRGTVGDKTRS